MRSEDLDTTHSIRPLLSMTVHPRGQGWIVLGMGLFGCCGVLIC